MSDISDLESRISAAMDRIGRGLEKLDSNAATTTTDNDAVAAELEAEKTANAQLEERIKALNARLEEAETDRSTAVEAVEKAAEARESAELELKSALSERDKARAALEAAEAKLSSEAETDEDAADLGAIDLERNRDAIAELSARLRRIRRTSRQVRGTNQMLRDAAVKGLSDPNLINQALAAELESLKAMRAAELAEMGLIVSALRPLIDPNATEGSDEEGDS